MTSASPLLQRLNYHLNQCSRIYHEMSLAYGLTDSQSNILYTLACTREPVCQRELCILTGQPKQTVNSTIRQLMEESCITLVPGAGRRQLIHLTQKGQALIEEKIAPVIQAENNALAAMGPDAQLLLTLMGRFTDYLTKEHQS